ncbi:histidine triad nucleotide-binding protein, partial [Oleispira antarctica]
MTDCLFCKIVAGDIPSETVFEDDDFFAFRDISPKADTHLLL